MAQCKAEYSVAKSPSGTKVFSGYVAQCSDSSALAPDVITSAVVVAASALSSYALPNKDFALGLWIWRLIILALSSIIGLYGMMIGLILLLHHWSQMETLGEPYLSPLSSLDGSNLSDSVVRVPHVFRKKKSLKEQENENVEGKDEL